MPPSCPNSPKWGRLKFEHSAARFSAPYYHPYTIQPTDYITGEYRSAARKQGGTTSGNYVSQATRPSLRLSHTRVVLIDIHSTADEVPVNVTPISVTADYFDPLNAPFASVKIFYRPRGTRIFPTFPETRLMLLLELLIAEGVITGYGVGARIGGGPEANDRKRAREDHSSGPSTKRRTGSTVKREEVSVDARAQRIQALQVSRVNYSVLHAVAPDKLTVTV
jgi:hypothetical protein